MPKKEEKKKTKKRIRRKGRYLRGEHVSLKTGQLCKYRSGWEKKYMEHLDSDPTVISWGYESFAILYTSNKSTGKVRKYYPDFIVSYADGRMEVVEIKQKRKLTQVAVVKKTLAAIEWCRQHNSEYKIITEVELKSLGLL